MKKKPSTKLPKNLLPILLSIGFFAFIVGVNYFLVNYGHLHYKSFLEN